MKFCQEYFFKLYFDMKVRHTIVDVPFHILTGLRIPRTQPEKVKDAVTFYVTTGARYSHPECLLTLLASSDPGDRKFTVGQILKLKGR